MIGIIEVGLFFINFFHFPLGKRGGGGGEREREIFGHST